MQTTVTQCILFNIYPQAGAVGASGVLVWGYAFMSVRNRFTIEICGFTHSLRTSSARAAIVMAGCSLVPRAHPHGEEKESGYNTTSRPTLDGHNQIP